MKFIGYIKNHYFQFNNQPYVRQGLSKYEGKEVVIDVEPVRGGVSDNLRGYYYAAVLPTVKATVPEWQTLTDEDVHEILKIEFNGFNYFSPIHKETRRVGRSAMSWSDSDTKRALDFIEKIRQWLLENYLVELPNPDDHKRYRDSAPMVQDS